MKFIFLAFIPVCAMAQIKDEPKKFSYDLGDLKFSREESNKLITNNLLYESKQISLKFNETLNNKTNFDIKLGDFLINNESIRSSGKLPIVGMNEKYDNKWSISYRNEDTSINFSRFTNNNKIINVANFENKKHKILLSKSNSPMVFQDYWQKPAATNFYFSISGKNYFSKFIDDYQEFNYHDLKFNLSFAKSNDKLEINSTYDFNKTKINFVKYQDDLINIHYLNAYSKDFNFKSINSEIQSFQSKNFSAARFENDLFLNASFSDIKSKIYYGDNGFKYKISMGQLGFDKGLIYNLKFKGLSAELSNHQINQASFGFKNHQGTFFIEFQNDHQIRDFSLNRNLFNFYSGSDFLEETNVAFKKSLFVNFSNNSLALKSDIINDIYQFSLKSNGRSVYYLKNEKNNSLGVLSTFKGGSLQAEYNIDSSKFNKLQFNYFVKF